MVFKYFKEIIPVTMILLITCNDPTLHYKLPRQDAAFDVVAKNFKEVFPAQELQPPSVQWSMVYCPGTLKTAVVIDNDCYSGLYREPEAPEVAWRGSFGTSAYSHELMHYYLKKFEGNDDANHERQWFWQVVQKTDEELQGMQL